MNILYSLFFAAGVTAFVYSRFGQRLGYGNTQNQVTLGAVVFVIAFIVFFTLFSFIKH